MHVFLSPISPKSSQFLKCGNTVIGGGMLYLEAIKVAWCWYFDVKIHISYFSARGSSEINISDLGFLALHKVEKHRSRTNWATSVSVDLRESHKNLIWRDKHTRSGDSNYIILEMQRLYTIHVPLGQIKFTYIGQLVQHVLLLVRNWVPYLFYTL